MVGPSSVAEDELLAYADGFLSPDRRADVEAYLSAAPEERRRIEAYRRQNVELHRLFDRPELRVVPGRYVYLADGLARSLRRQRVLRASLHGAAGLAVAVLMVGAAWTGYEGYIRRENPLVAFTRQATQAHWMLVGKGYPTDAAVKTANGAKLFGWYARQFGGVPNKAPNLGPEGFRLVGGRVLPTSYGPAVQLLYQNPAKHHVTLFLGPSNTGHKTAFTVIEEGNVSLIYWQMGPLAYSLIGNVDRKTLLGLAKAVSESLSAPDGGAAKPPATGEAAAGVTLPVLATPDGAGAAGRSRAAAGPAASADGTAKPPAVTDIGLKSAQ